MIRPSSAMVIRPKFAVPIWMPGWPNRVWLNRLNASTRSWMRWLARQVDVLEQRQVRPREAGAADGVAARVARSVPVSRHGAAHEAAGVEPLIDGVRGVVVRVARHVRAVRQVADVGGRIVDAGREAGLRLDDAVDLPAAEHVLARPSQGSSASAAPRRS